MIAPVGLLEACADEGLFNVGLWPGQARVLERIEQGPRMHVLACGRRSGKSLMCALVGLWHSLLRDDLNAFVREGETRFAVIVAVNRRQAQLVVRAAASIVEASPVLRPLVQRVSEETITFTCGTAITALACSSRSVRGWPVSALIFDEFAHFVTGSEGPAAAARVYEALTPSVAQFGDEARVLVSSTPAGDANEFGRLYHLAADGELEGAVAHQASTAEMNPAITRAFLASEEKRDPISFSAEYEARFSGGSGAFFEEDLLEACVAGDHELDPAAATNWTAGLDPGIWRDPFGLVLVGREAANPARLTVGCVRAWAPPKRKPESAQARRELQDGVLSEVGDVLTRYGVRQAISDGFLGPAVDEALRARGLWPERLTLTGAMRLEVFSALRAAMQGGRLSLYRHKGLLSELARVRTSYRGGSLSVETPRSAAGHFDLAISLALAVWAIEKHGRGGRGMPLVDESGRGEPRGSIAHGLMSREF